MFKGVEPLLQGYEVLGEGVEDIEFGYAVSGQFCVLLFRAKGVLLSIRSFTIH